MLKIENLSVSFRSDEGLVTPVKNVSFAVERGKTLGLVGESGSGKSVSTKALMQLLPGTSSLGAGSRMHFTSKSGELIEIEKLHRNSREMRHIRGGEIGMIFQEPMASFSPVYTIGNQVTEAIRRHRDMNKKEACEYAIEMLDRVGIVNPSARIDQYPHEMSGGMRQRAMIALALSAGPSLLIADEPTTALDVTIQAQVLELMKDLQREMNMGMIFITHDLGVIAQIADEVAVMYKGEIVERGDVREVIRNPQQAYTQRLLDAIPRLDTVMPPALLAKPGEDSRLIDVQDLRVAFPIKKKKLFRTETEMLPVVKGVSFSIRKGETVGLVGESGSGKTTVGRAMLRAIDPTGGEVIFHTAKGDVDLAHASEGELRQVRQKLGMTFKEGGGGGVAVHDLAGEALRAFRPRMSLVFQDPYSSLNPRMTVRDIIAEPLVAGGLMKNREEIDARVREIAARCKLDLEHLRRFPHAFSGGQRQRICIARALVSNPEFVVCDESVSALDVSTQAEIVDLLRELQEETGASFLFIAHDLAVVAQISHSIAVLYRGQFVEYAPTAKLFASPQHPYTKALLSAIPHPDPDAVFAPVKFDDASLHPVVEPHGDQFRIVAEASSGVPDGAEARFRDIGGGHFVSCYLASEMRREEEMNSGSKASAYREDIAKVQYELSN